MNDDGHFDDDAHLTKFSLIVALGLYCQLGRTISDIFLSLNFRLPLCHLCCAQVPLITTTTLKRRDRDHVVVSLRFVRTETWRVISFPAKSLFYIQ